MPSAALTVLHLDAQLLIQIGWQLFNTAIIIAFLAFLLYKPVRQFLRNRQLRISGQLDDAAAKLSEAEGMKSEYVAKIANVEMECTDLLQDARAKALKREDEIIAQAKEEAKVIVERARLDIEREQAKALDDMRVQIINLSMEVSRKYLQGKIDEKAQNKLLDEAIADLGDVKWND